MDKERMLALPKLRVYEDQKVWIYSLNTSNDGYPYYSAPPIKSQFHKNVLMDDFLYLPIDKRDFEKDRSNYFYGYRFLVAISDMTTVVGIPDLHLAPSAELTINFEACRVRYFMDDDDSFDIAIDFMGDGLFPTRRITTTQSPKSARENTKDVIEGLINQYCRWYADRKL